MIEDLKLMSNNKKLLYKTDQSVILDLKGNHS